MMGLQKLPIDEILPDIVRQLSAAGAVVLKAEPGAGKTTRVPPAILDAGLAELADKRPGQIVVLQPRRVAARAAAMRIAEERGGVVGDEIGYQVRHEGRVSKKTRIIVCTEGIFLRRLQDDPFIENIAAVVFDEFHERSLDSDLALAMTRLVRQQVRPDLKIVVMSATLDSGPIARYLDDCPAIESPGRTYPVAIEYLQFPANAPADRLVVDGVKQMLAKANSSSERAMAAGHLLVFLPGVGEIRASESALQAIADQHDLAIMPLYGELPLEEQQRVLRPSKQRKVVLATNIAETSVTIDGVSTVIDTGTARINRFNAQLGLNSLELTRISKASAAQRAGRAGRTGPGMCLRMWTEKEHQMLPDFEVPEIYRVDLSECLLRLHAFGERDAKSFPWFESPPTDSLGRAESLLDRLDAISDGNMTDLGKQMAGFPLQPRLARLLIEGSRGGDPRRAALCAALLSERSPFRREPGPPSKTQHHSDSDVLDRVWAIQSYEEKNLRHSIVGELMPAPTKQILRARDQLARLDVGAAAAPPAAAATDDEPLLRSIATAFPDRICKRRSAKDQRAVMVGGRGVRLSDESAVVDSDLFVAVELIDLDRSELIVRQASRVDRSWLPQSHIFSGVEVEYDAARQKVIAMKRTRFCELVLEETIASIPPGVDPGSVLAEALAAGDVGSLVDDDAKNYLARIECLREWMPELDLPDFGEDPWKAFLPDWCCGSSSVAELKDKSLLHAIQSRLTAEQIVAIDREAPEKVAIPTGRQVRLQYEAGKPPILAARIQELFGLTETPRVARARTAVLVHLLAPNYRVQQITPDLASFWKNTYPEVKKELKGRYPKHKWPDDPLKPSI